MNHFTTIAALRKSSAMANRVTQVETGLKKRLAIENVSDVVFPTAFVLITNGKADFDWVLQGSASLNKKPTAITIELLTKIAEQSGVDDAYSKSDGEKYLAAMDKVLKEAGTILPFFPSAQAAVAATPVAAEGVSTVVTDASSETQNNGLKSSDTSSGVPDDKDQAKPDAPAGDAVEQKPTKDVVKQATAAVKKAKITTPLPSVLKTIRDAAKSHPSITMIEDKTAKTITIKY